jgi:hypothetical protein
LLDTAAHRQPVADLDVGVENGFDSAETETKLNSVNWIDEDTDTEAEADADSDTDTDTNT